MKFELPEEEVKLIDGKLVQLPAKRFIALLDYVEDLEGKLLTAQVELRESERVGSEMERYQAGRQHEEKLTPEALHHIQEIVDELTDPAKLKAAGERKGLSIRRLSIISGIPYATLHRYLTRKVPLDLQSATKINQAIFDSDLRMKQYSPKGKGLYVRHEKNNYERRG